MNEHITPYQSDASKKEQVAEMFDNIAHSYDFLNHFFSLGIDKRWRKKAIRKVLAEDPKRLMDVATGTGDFALAAKRLGVQAEEIVGVDISPGMLEVGRKKVDKHGWSDVIRMEVGDSENLPFEANYFDAFTVAFGVRNFQHLEAGLADMLRVLRPGGIGVILEFSRPKRFPMKQLFHFYFRALMPLVGRLVSKDARAYTYLPESVAAFPDGEDFLNILRTSGYREVTAERLTGGIATIYTGRK